MARPTKQGVDYFPLDVHLDNKFKFIEIKFGLEGFAVIIKILQEIYSQGYFCKWGVDERLLFSDEHKVEKIKLDEITQECLKRDIFNEDIYKKHEILTSKGVQTRYQEIVRRRKDVEVEIDYLLISGMFGVNDNIMSTLRKHDVSESTQSKVKESKVKESNNYVHDLFDHYCSKNIINHKKITEPMIRAVNARLKDYSFEDLKQAIDNYATVFSSDDYWFTHKYPFADFMRDKDIRKFVVEADPLNNYARDKNNNGFKQSHDPRDKEIALQKWISEGNNPDEFDWSN